MYYSFEGYSKVCQNFLYNITDFYYKSNVTQLKIYFCIINYCIKCHIVTLSAVSRLAVNGILLAYYSVLIVINQCRNFVTIGNVQKGPLRVFDIDF